MKPYVQVACVCENVLQQEDKVVSLIRIVDTYHLHMPAKIPEGIKPAVELTAFVAVKSGDVTGSHEIGLQLKSPSGKKGPLQKWPVVLAGGEQGANLIMKFQIAQPELGLYWFDVLWGDEVLTSIPFRLKLAEAPVVVSDSPSASTH